MAAPGRLGRGARADPSGVRSCAAGRQRARHRTPCRRRDADAGLAVGLGRVQPACGCSRGSRPRWSSRGSSTWSTPWRACSDAGAARPGARVPGTGDERRGAWSHCDPRTQPVPRAKLASGAQRAGVLRDAGHRARRERKRAQERLNELRSALQVERGRQASLEALQQAARERAEGGGVEEWLRQERSRRAAASARGPAGRAAVGSEAVETVLGTSATGRVRGQR
jgi:hypothetical protein